MLCLVENWETVFVLDAFTESKKMFWTIECTRMITHDMGLNTSWRKLKTKNAQSSIGVSQVRRLERRYGHQAMALLPSHNPFHFNFRLFFVSNSFIRWRWCDGNKQTIESTDIQLKNIWIALVYSLVKLFHLWMVCGRSPATGTHSLIHLISVVLTLVHAPFPWRNTTHSYSQWQVIRWITSPRCQVTRIESKQTKCGRRFVVSVAVTWILRFSHSPCAENQEKKQ